MSQLYFPAPKPAPCPNCPAWGESLGAWLKRNQHQSLAILKESAQAMGFTKTQWSMALAEYYATR